MDRQTALAILQARLCQRQARINNLRQEFGIWLSERFLTPAGATELFARLDQLADLAGAMRQQCTEIGKQA